MSSVCASYARRSKDLDRNGLNVAAQERDNVQRADDNNDVIPDEHKYVDNDVAASRFAKKPRTDWLKLREAIERGEVRKVYTLMLDRLLRLPGELEWLIDQAFIGKFRSIVTDEEELDLTTEAGISRARGMAHAADMEVRKLSKRVRRAFNEKRSNGESHQPVIVLGWLGTRHGHDNNHGDTIHEYEAALIRDAAERVVRGASYSDIARTWNADGVMKPKAMHFGRKSTPWTPTEVKNVLTLPRNAGYQVHDGEVIGKPWPVIIPEATYRKLVAKTERHKVGPRSVRRSGRWTGVVRCGGFMEDGTPCGATMLANVSAQRGGKRVATFRCQARDGRRACGNNAITATAVEAFAHEAIGTYVNDDVALRRGVMREDNTLEPINAELRTLDTRKREALEDRALGRLSRAEANVIVDACNARIAELDRKLTNVGGRDSLSPWLNDGDGLLEWLNADTTTAAEHRAAFIATDHFVWIKPRTEARPSKAVDHRARMAWLPEHPATAKKARAKKARTA